MGSLLYKHINLFQVICGMTINWDKLGYTILWVFYMNMFNYMLFRLCRKYHRFNRFNLGVINYLV